MCSLRLSAVWTAFSIAATALQWSLSRVGLLSPMMQTTAPAAGAVILLAAGIYQLTPFKGSCLAHCRSPVAYIAEHWADGTNGALRMGLRHGLYCLGCCWALMLLLFFGGVMSLAWIALLAIAVLVEICCRSRAGRACRRIVLTRPASPCCSGLRTAGSLVAGTTSGVRREASLRDEVERC
jgi:predicted metal-binding membrane protein